MKKALHSFPLKPLVIALAAAQSFAVLAGPLPISVITNTYPSSTPFTVQTDTLTVNSDASIVVTSNALTNEQHTLLVDNNGTLAGSDSAVYNLSTIDVLRNGQSGVITKNNNDLSSSYGVIYNDIGATITTLENSGTINSGNIDNQSNQSAITNDGTITTLTNKQGGTIYGNGVAIANSGTLTELNNAGTIRAISNDNLGLLPTSNAIVNVGVLGVINNSGTIAGDIINVTSNELVINGGENRRGSLIGSAQMNYSRSLPLSSPIGAIYNNGADLRFQSGQLLLNDNVFLGGNTLTNNADVLVNENLAIDGNYHQTANAILNIGVSDASLAQGISLSGGYGRLNVSGNALIDEGSSIKLLNTGSYGFADGQRYVVINATTADYNASTLHYSADNFNGSVTGYVQGNDISQSLVVALQAGNGNTSNPGKPLPTTGNAISSLKGLSSYSGISSPQLLNLFNASKTITTQAEANRVGEQLSPGQNSMASAATSAASMDALGV
ncbi:hypothetical protein, partial [Pseudomonas graminis]